ncbi:MAG: mono/diheme cytochrome c family protein [Planctomycetota bacterium]|jgi:mono/diheme cytochrome c family protein
MPKNGFESPVRAFLNPNALLQSLHEALMLRDADFERVEIIHLQSFQVTNPMKSRACWAPLSGLPGVLHRGITSRRGAVSPALLFWLLAILLFVVPFLRKQDSADWNGDDDPRRVDNWAVPEEPYNEIDMPFWPEVDSLEVEMSDLFEGGLRSHIETSSAEWFGVSSEHLRGTGILELRRLAAGRKTYNAECAGCHGTDLALGQAPGDGAGPAARYMIPRPRNFRKGMFKFTSTESGGRPRRKDLYKSVSFGMAGASMPHFKLLTEERRHDVVEYVRYISMRGEFEELLLSFCVDDEEFTSAEETAELIYERWDEGLMRSVFPSSPEPEADEASIARGRELYMDPRGAGCVGCHGETGVGDGPSAEKFQDGWGYPIKPRDFTSGVYRAGSENMDLWGVIATGINGTPMGSFVGVLSSDEIWNIVHFVRSLEKSVGDN